MSEPTAKEILEAAVQQVITPVLDLLQKDSHHWSTRPCSTCQTISTLVGKPFGCILYAQQHRK